MGELLEFPKPIPTDGGKARIKRRRQAIKVEHMFHGSALSDDLTMDHVDTGLPSDSPYCAPETDPA